MAIVERSAAFSLHTRRIVTASGDRTARIWGYGDGAIAALEGYCHRPQSERAART
jgi:hypothetical protein